MYGLCIDSSVDAFQILLMIALASLELGWEEAHLAKS